MSEGDPGQQGVVESTFKPWDWSRVERRLRNDMLMDDLHAAGVRRNMIGWPEGLTAYNSIEHLSRAIDEEQVRVLELAVEPVNTQLATLADDYIARVKSLQEEVWARQLYDVEPLKAGDEPAKLPMGTSSFEYPGWRVSYSLKMDEHPELKDLQGEMASMRHERRFTVEATMRTFPRNQ